MRILFLFINIISVFLIVIDANANDINLSDIYKNILFVEGIPNQHGRAKDAYGRNQYNIPISLNNLNTDNIKKSLYLIGTDQPDNEIVFSHFEKDPDRYENYQVAVYKSKSGQALNYKLISTKNDQKYKDKFYKAIYIKDGPIKEQIDKMVNCVFRAIPATLIEPFRTTATLVHSPSTGMNISNDTHLQTLTFHEGFPPGRLSADFLTGKSFYKIL